MIFRHVTRFKVSALLIITLSVIFSLFWGQFITPGRAYSGNYALSFNGTDELVWIGPGGSVIGTLGSTWKSLKTISVWVRPLGVPRAPAFGGSPGDLDPIVTTETKFFGITRGLLQVSPGVYQDGIYVWNFDGLFQYVRIPYTGGEWIHVTLIHSGGRLYGYKNGVLAGSVASGDTNTPRTDLSWSIGGSTFGGFTPKFQGQIDEVAIFGAALSQETIRDWMYREYTSDHPNWGSLGAYYKMSDGSGTSLSDNSGGGTDFPGTFFGTPDWVHSGAFAGPRNALDFDGSDDTVWVPDAASLDLASGLTFEAWAKP